MDSKALKSWIEPVLKKHQVVFYNSEFVQEGKEHFLRIYIDKINGTMDLDTCVAVSEDISLLLDQHDPIAHDYILEVSSAGAERPLKTKEDFQLALHKDIWVVLTQPIETFDELIGTLLEVKETSFQLQIKIKTRVKVVEIAFETVKQAMTTVRF